MRPQVGLVINNKYRLVRLIGDGGMGSVYEARHEVLGTTVALKFLHPELARRGGLVQRFLQEARVSAAIQSPHVVRVSDVDQTSTGLAYIVMEYLEGRTLQTLYEDLYRAGQRLTYGDALEYTMQLFEGVEAAHKAGIVHRDLKPDNVMITKGLKGEPLIKILDFGIAKLRVTGELDKGLTRPGVIMGTPEYMAPEQAYSADAVDARADIFSLGVIVFEMLAGRRPVGGDDPHQIASAYLAGQVAKLTELAPHVDPALAEAIHKAMAPLAKDRFATVGELRAAIEPFLPARAGVTPLPTPVGDSSPKAAASPVAQLAPPTNVEEPDAPRAVPKTLPPEDGGPPSPAALGEIDPAAARHPAATPLGGFDAPAAEPPREVSSPALGAAAEAPPASPVEPPRRPGGTDIAGEPFGGAPIPVATPVALEAPPEVRAYVGGTAMDAGSYAPTPAPARKRKASGIGSFLLIVLFAGGVASAVVGGLYVAQQYGHRDEAADTPPTAPIEPPPTTLVSSAAPPPTDQPVSTTPVSTAPPPPTQAYKPPPVSHPTTPPPQTTTPAPTVTTPPPQPTSPSTSTPRPPFVLPSSLPTINFPIPGLPPLIPGQPTTPPPPQPTTPPPPQPTTTSSGHTRPPIIIHFPKAGRRLPLPHRTR